MVAARPGAYMSGGARSDATRRALGSNLRSDLLDYRNRCLCGALQIASGGTLGAKIGIAAFILAAIYWGSLAYAHKLAVNQARSLATIVANQNGESITELAAMPTLANPFHWQSVFETDRATYRFDLNLTSQADLSGLVRYEKPDPAPQPLITEALKDKRAQILSDFARFPVVRVDPNCVNQTLVEFADLRYTEPGGSRGPFSLDVPVECPAQGPVKPK